MNERGMRKNNIKQTQNGDRYNGHYLPDSSSEASDSNEDNKESTSTIQTVGKVWNYTKDC